MLQHILVLLVLVLLVLIFFVDLRRLFSVAAPTQSATKGTRAKPPCPLRPRTPEDCPACRAAASALSPTPIASSPLRPWCEVKSRRGARKRIPTEGYACPNRECKYHNITNSQVHALVGYGHHGQAEPIQDLFCQACQRKFTVRRHTPLYRLKTSAARVSLILTALAEGYILSGVEGLSVAGAVRTFGHAETTITRWLQRAGGQAERMHRRLFRNLHLLHVQLDELRTTLRHKGHEVWVWIALDAQSKSPS